ncbi:hypothetical protein B0A72_15405 [Flavobacterium pectinovorum]|uniref:Uncharacterized protein n=1 Tax=Flavobacterium pectinovorum TaxID=29533 RepID=A0AB36NY48_9FLAO|nr:hypothetical protein B0A72_15405 [Flavobacterium pectinovorum]
MKMVRFQNKKYLIPVLQNLTTTFFITFTLASINCTNKSAFLFFWMRSWLVAGLISNLFSLFIFYNKK